MQSTSKYADVDIIDGGTAPDLFSLLDDSVEKLIIVDALRSRGEAGSIYHFDISEENIAVEPPDSIHGLGVLDSLQMMIRLGIRPPKVVLIGIEPFDVSDGFSLSTQMEALVPQVIDEVEKELQKPY
jgi:hydrogenase maturation protease